MSAADRIGLEFISTLGLSPVDHIRVAADLGCRHVGLGPEPIAVGGPHRPWSLRTDPALRRDTLAALRDTGVSLSIGEGFMLRRGNEPDSMAADLDLMAELGAARVNVLALGSDCARGFDQLATFAAMAAARGLPATLEFLPDTAIGDLVTALAAVRHAGRPDFTVLIDAMHLFRSGGGAADVAAADPASIGYLQLCDVPLASPADYGAEARYERLPPGEGELPLADLLAAAPADVIVGLEVPMRAKADAGVDARTRLAPCIATTMNLLERADACRGRRADRQN